MSSVQLQLNPLWSWPIVLIVILALTGAVWLGYRLAEGLPKGRRHLLLGVRLVTMSLLVVAILRPQLQWISDDGEKPEVWILADASRSMGIAEGSEGQTRRISLLNLLNSVNSPLDALKQSVEVQEYDFAETLIAQDELNESAEGGQTALGNVLQEVIRSKQQRTVASVFLLTDGAQRAVPPFDADPREAARELGEMGVALYPIPIGQAVSTQAAVDVAVEEIQVDPVVFVKKRVPVRVQVRWSGASGQRLRVRLLLEDRTGLRIEQSGPLRPIPRSEFSQPEVEIETRYPNGSQVVELAFTPEQSGEYKLAAQIEPLTGEVQTRNNLRETLVQVRQGGLRIAYFDIFRTEIKSIRQLNSSDKMQVDFQLVRSGAFRGKSSIEARWFEPGRYDVFIIGDVSAEQIGSENLNLLAQRIREGAGLLMLGGYQTYSAGGYATSPLAGLIPVELNPAEKVAPGQLDQRHQIQDDIVLQPTSAGNRHYVTRIAGLNENEAAWQSLPPLSGATRIQPKSDFVEVLATSDAGVPLIVAAETGRSRVMCLAFDQTYLWSQAGFEDEHRRFWRQAVLWLAHKELDTDQPVWLTIVPKTIDPGGRVQFEYGARDEQGQPVPEASYRVSVTRPDGQAQQITGSATEQGQAASFTETLQPGDYVVQVEASAGGRGLGFPAQSRFIVHDRDLELDYPIVDRGLLNELAQQAGLATDSRVINPENLEAFLKDYLQRKPWQTGQDVYATWNLWDGWPILLLFSSLMTIEWVLRKRGGLV